MQVTYYGHSCVGIKIKADYILITTAQQDHTGDVERIAKRTKAQIISNFEISNYFFNLGLENAHPMDLGGAYSFPFGIVKMVPALHSSTFENGSAGGCACGAGPGLMVPRAEVMVLFSVINYITLEMRRNGNVPMPDLREKRLREYGLARKPGRASGSC